MTSGVPRGTLFVARACEGAHSPSQFWIRQAYEWCFACSVARHAAVEEGGWLIRVLSIVFGRARGKHCQSCEGAEQAHGLAYSGSPSCLPHARTPHATPATSCVPFGILSCARRGTRPDPCESAAFPKLFRVACSDKGELGCRMRGWSAMQAMLRDPARMSFLEPSCTPRRRAADRSYCTTHSKGKPSTPCAIQHAYLDPEAVRRQRHSRPLWLQHRAVRVRISITTAHA
jgi:hypothetical protein